MSTSLGRDTSCLSELRSGRFVTGGRLVGESVYRRLTTPRGSLRGGEDEADFGFDLSDLVGSAATAADVAALPGRIEAELLKDERIESVSVDVENTSTGVGIELEVTIEAETSEGPFTLQLSVDDVTVELLGLSEEVSS
jgi:hypothetical protein